MEVNGVLFRPTITTEEDNNANCDECPKKQNFNESLEQEYFVTNHLLHETIEKGKSKGTLKRE